MNMQNQVVFSWLYFVTSILLWQKSFSLDPNYEACVPKDCGNGINLSFPFYIPDQHPSFCGYPGYEVNCSKEGDAMILLPHNDYYIIEQISYENRSVQIYNAALSSPRNRSSCLPEIRNLTLLNELNKFILNPVSFLYLFSSCNKVLPEELSRYKVGCDGLVILDKDGYSENAKKVCKSVVVAPVELQVTEGSIVGADNYEELLRKGFLVGWQSSTDCRECSRSGGRCGFDWSVYTFKCFCPDEPHAWNCDSTRKRKWVVKFASGISASGIAVILFLYLRRKYFPGELRIFGKKSEDHDNIEAFLKNYGSVAPKRYSYSDIKKITDSFKEKLGQGGYGCVYKGTLMYDRSPVAVKVLQEAKGNGEQFVNEVASISRTSHVNIVSLLGFCFEGSKRALIYEFVPNGSLEKFIYNENSLSKGAGRLNWENLLEIAVGIARGLEYLHRGCRTRILHLDIKPHNILLDKDFRPKICDFGLAKLCPDTASSMISLFGARGTVGYIAPEVFFRNFGEVSHKSDVYSYGMMIMEMVRGRKTCDDVVDISSEFYFPNWIYDRLDVEDIGLRGLTNEMEYQRARKMVIVGLWCIQAYPITRPSMGRVVEMLEGSIENLQTPPKPFLS